MEKNEQMLLTESLQPELSITPHLLQLCLVPPPTLLQCFDSVLISIYHLTVSPDATHTALPLMNDVSVWPQA